MDFSTARQSRSWPENSGSARGTCCGFFFATPARRRAKSPRPGGFKPRSACSTKPQYHCRRSLLRPGSKACAVSMMRSAPPTDGRRLRSERHLVGGCRSEIRLLRLRHHRNLSAGLPRILGAYEVRPGADGRPVRDGRRPGHREDVFVLDGKMELQHLAPVVGVEFPAAAGAEIFFFVAFNRV